MLIRSRRSSGVADRVAPDAGSVIAARIGWPYSLSPLKRRLTLIRPDPHGVRFRRPLTRGALTAAPTGYLPWMALSMAYHLSAFEQRCASSVGRSWWCDP